VLVVLASRPASSPCHRGSVPGGGPGRSTGEHR
jgi:hypothetical protein